MKSISIFVRSNIKNFVKEKRQNSQSQKIYLFDQLMKDFESSPEKMTMHDFFCSMRMITTDDEIFLWFLDLQVKVFELKRKGSY